MTVDAATDAATQDAFAADLLSGCVPGGAPPDLGIPPDDGGDYSQVGAMGDSVRA